MTTQKLLSEPRESLFRIKRGLSAYVSYLAACEMNQAFSEYVLYEPVLRILTARGYGVKCEVEAPGIKHSVQGDRKRLDFVAESDEVKFALEVKWATKKKIDVVRDIEKLGGYQKANPGSSSFLCVFGRQTILRSLELPEGMFKEHGTAVYADLRRTKYGCRIYTLRPESERPLIEV